MSAYTPTVPPMTFEPPGIKAPFMISRSAEADRITNFILSKKSRFMVLCGPEESGKTVLVTRWLIPALRKATARDGYLVFYGQCNRLVPDVLSGEDGSDRFDELITRKSILIVDEFDWVLDLPRDERRSQIDALFTRLQRASPEAIVVVVVSQRHLTSMYALASYDPGIVNAVCEVKAVGLADGLEQLSDEDPASSLAYTPDLLQALRDESKDLTKRGVDVTFDLLKLLHGRFCLAASETSRRQIDLAQYTAIGGLTGVLREHVDHTLDALETERAGSDKLARAILERILDAHSRGAMPDFDEVARRSEVSTDEVRALVARLAAPGGLLLETTPGQFQFQPPQIITIVQEDSALRQLQRERAMRIVEEGMRSRQQLGTFLPPARFAEIHKQRRYLILDDDLVRFLVQCALRDSGAETDAAEYWLRRVASPDDAMDILLAAAFDTSADVRGRAASLLGEFQEPLVRDRLCVLALTDPAPAVRAASINSLGRMADDALLAHLLQEVHGPTATHRKEAIDALRIFPRKEVATMLCALVREPGTDLAIREKSVAVLAALNIDESVDALVDIALNDPDADDRKAAAKALCAAGDEKLNHRILSRLAWRRPTKRIAATGIVLTAGLAALMFVVLLLIDAVTFPILRLLFIGLLAVAAASGVLLVRLRDGRLQWKSPVGVLAVTLFGVCAVTIVPLVHGLAHVMIGRTRRGLQLFGLELLGIVSYGALAGATEFVPGLRYIANGYRLLGGALFIGSYLYDVLVVALGTIIFRRTMAREDHRSAIFREVFRNPSMVDVVFGLLRSSDATEAQRAKRLIGHFGERMGPTKLMDMLTVADSVSQPFVVQALTDAKDDDTIGKLERRWSSAGAVQQEAIEAVLSASPTSRSIEALEHVGARTGAVVKMRAVFARLKFRLAVWPWQAHFAAWCLVPALGVLLYHGTMIRRNPAWAEIITLRQPTQTPQQKVKIVNFLADAYPHESLEQLQSLFHERRRAAPDSLLAALVRALVTLENTPNLIPLNDPVRAELALALVRFDSLLWQKDSSQFVIGVGVLRAMANASDTTLSKQAVGFLAEFVGADTGTYKDIGWRQQPTVRAIGSMPYARGLPVLDSLLKRRIVDKVQPKNSATANVTDLIRDQIVRVAKQAYAAVPERTGVQERTKLLATLNTLTVPVPEITALKRQLDNANRVVASGCDRSDDGKCEALKAISESPMGEDAYRDLLGHYASSKQYTEATTEFLSLKERQPESIWPRKMLAELYHEDRSAEDASFFEQSYNEMVALRKLAAFTQMRTRAPDDYVRVEADFVETALSARRYAETESTARDLLADKTESVDRPNMMLFIYMAAVMKRDTALASTRLSELEQVIRALPAGYYNNWNYPGTLVFVDQSNLPAPLKAALRKLCKGGQWYSLPDAEAVIAENRAALGTLGAKGPY